MAGAPTALPTLRVRIALVLAKDQAQRAWLALDVRGRDDGQLGAVLPIDDALPVSQALTPAQRTILKTEIMGGVITARRTAKRGCMVTLVELGGEVGGVDGGIIKVPSIAFAVAANLAVLQGLGIEDLRSAPRGGYGWALDSVTVTELLAGSRRPRRQFCSIARRACRAAASAERASWSAASMSACR